MAVLSEGSRVAIWSKFMRENLDDIDITKQDLRAAFDAADTFIDNNAGAYNASIPQPARSALSAGQKALIFMLAANERFDVI